MSNKIKAIFVSPHFDDVALSCGGTASLLAREGRVVVVTVFAARPPTELNRFAEFQHQRWGIASAAVDQRSQEDASAMGILGADYRWLDFPDAIYRGDLYLTDDDLFGPVKPADCAFARTVRQAVIDLTQTWEVEQVYLPLAIGGHVDHRICHEIAVPLAENGSQIWLYEDFPYALAIGAVEAAVIDTARPLVPHFVDVTSTFEQRLAAIACYPSQIPTIFRYYGEPDGVTRGYASRLSGQPGQFVERFWRPYP